MLLRSYLDGRIESASCLRGISGPVLYLCVDQNLLTAVY